MIACRILGLGSGLVLGILLGASVAGAFSGGITGLTTTSTGCNQCHSGGSTPSVTLSGPTAVAPGSTNEYVLEITAVGSQTFGGLDAGATGGTLAVGGTESTNTQLLAGEITHTQKKAASGGVIRFSFLWTAPSVPGSFQLRAWGNAVNGNGANSGDRAAFASLTVDAGPTWTPTPTSTSTPTPTPTPLQHDVVLLPVAARNIKLPANSLTPVVRKFPVKVRYAANPGASAQSVTIVQVGTDCPPGIVFSAPDFDPKTGGSQNAAVLGPGQSKTAMLEVTADRSAVTSRKPTLPFRCFVYLHAEVQLAGNVDPSPSNNDVPVELNFFDLGDPPQATPGEAWLKRAPHALLVIPAGQATKTFLKTVTVANADSADAALGLTVDATTCPWLSATADMVPKSPSQEPNVIVAAGKSKTGGISWFVDGLQLDTPNRQAPLRCVATVSVVGPASPDPEPTNDGTKIILDVLDKNDM